MSDEEKCTEGEFSEKFEELRWNLLNAYRPTLESAPQAFCSEARAGQEKPHSTRSSIADWTATVSALTGTTIESFTPASWSFSAFTGTKPLITPRHGRGA